MNIYPNQTKFSRLFQQCLQTLNAQALPEYESKQVSDLFVNMFPITKWGKIDWDRVKNKIYLGKDKNKIAPTLEDLIGKDFDHSVFIEWSEDYSVIKAELGAIIKHFDDVTCVAFDKFVFNLNEGYIIEVRHMNEITVGIVDAGIN